MCYLYISSFNTHGQGTLQGKKPVPTLGMRKRPGTVHTAVELQKQDTSPSRHSPQPPWHHLAVKSHLLPRQRC